MTWEILSWWVEGGLGSTAHNNVYVGPLGGGFFFDLQFMSWLAWLVSCELLLLLLLGLSTLAGLLDLHHSCGEVVVSKEVGNVVSRGRNWNIVRLSGHVCASHNDGFWEFPLLKNGGMIYGHV